MTRTFDTSLVVGLLLVVALLLLSIGLAYRNTQLLHEHSASVARSHAVLDALDQLISSVMDAETGERGYLITGDRTYLQPYNNAVAAIDEEIRYLKDLTRDNPDQDTNFSTLRPLIADRRKELQRSIDVRGERGFKAARKIAQTDRAKHTMDAIREVASQMRLEEEDTLAQRAAASDRSYRVAVATQLLTGAVALCMVAAFIYLLRRHLLVRARAAALLREEKEWFGTTLGSIGDAVIATDSGGRVVFLNAVANALTGRTQAEAVGQPLDLVLQIIDAETKTRIESPALRRLRNGSTLYSANQKILVGRDGTERFIDDSAAPIRDPQRGVLGTVLVFRDITERRRAEESLRFLAESGTILSSSLNYDATLKNVARLACNAISDYCFFDLMTEAGEVKRVAWAHKDPGKLAKMGDIWRFVPVKESKHDPVVKTLLTGKSEFVPQVDDVWMRNSATGPDHYQYMRDLECCSFMAVPVAVKGRTLGALSFCLTATSKRQFTDVDRTLAEELGRRAGLAVQNASLHEQLKQSAEELRRADRRKDEFLAVLAHELRNPLAPLSHGLQIIRRGGNDNYSVEDAHRMMERQLKQMVRLIDDLLDVSRITEGKLELRLEPVELAAVVNSAAEISRPIIEAAGQTLDMVLPAEEVYLHADAIRLAQVFSNLLNNGSKYAGPGTRIALVARQEGLDVIVKVTDAGIGIPAGMLSKVFDPFTQVNDSLERSRGGLGIGLTLVKQLVEMHGGSVGARSEGADKGAEFMVRLPAAVMATTKRGQPAGEVATKLAAGGGRHILVADDNEDAANSLTALLRIIGHDVRVVYDGAAAVELAAMIRPDVILLDIGMPRLNGFEAARDIRAQPWGKNVTLIAVTGYGQRADRRRSKEAGFDHHIVKPINPTVLEKLLASSHPTAA